jgi:hypothetical protein
LVLRDTDRNGDMITKSEVKTINLTAGASLNATTNFGNAYAGRAFTLSISHEDVTGPGQLYFREAAAACADVSATDVNGLPDSLGDIGYELRGDTTHNYTTIVEFYMPTVNKYFITGRPEHQALLDTYPALYTRTGKQMRVPTKGVFSNAIDMYRFYSPLPAGANSHAYLNKADHDLLVSIPNVGWVDEGIDFGAIRADATGTCPSWAPSKIYRSFRNSAVVSERNHRYSISLTEYNAATAAGWTPENVVFCAHSVTAP